METGCIIIIIISSCSYYYYYTVIIITNNDNNDNHNNDNGLRAGPAESTNIAARCNIYIYIYVYMCVYIHIYIYIYIHVVCVIRYHTIYYNIMIYDTMTCYITICSDMLVYIINIRSVRATHLALLVERRVSSNVANDVAKHNDP